MKKIFTCFLVLFFVFITTSFCEAAPKKAKKKPSKHKIELTTRDKFILVGDLYFAAKETNNPLVVCFHSYSMNASVWKDLAQTLRMNGYNVLAMDLRGHGRSVYNENLKIKSRFYFTDETWQKLPKDTIDTLKYIKTNYPKINTDDLIMIGADFGAGVAANSAVLVKKAPTKMVAISPMLEFKGITMPIRSEKFYNTKILMILSKTDKNTFNFYTKEPATVHKYTVGGPGNQLIKVNPEAFADIVNFIMN